MIALVATAAGAFAVDLDDGSIAERRRVRPDAGTGAEPAAARRGGGGWIDRRAIVDAKPPLLLSYDAGSTWRASGRGLPPGRAVAIADDDPDTIVYAARNRLYLSRDGRRVLDGGHGRTARDHERRALEAELAARDEHR